MSTTRTASVRRLNDHFEPEVSDPIDQRRLRGQLEQIDYTAFAANREALAQILGPADAAGFQRLAVAAAMARARWVKEALVIAESGVADAQSIERLAGLRASFEELSGAYEGLRRMVERGYLPWPG